MDISSFDVLIQRIVESKDGDEVKMLIKSYGDRRETKGIEEGWKNCKNVFAKSINIGKERLKKTILDYDESVGMIELIDFIYFYKKIENELKNQMKRGSFEERKFAENIYNLMSNSLGNVNVDGRKAIPLFAAEKKHNDLFAPDTFNTAKK